MTLLKNIPFFQGRCLKLICPFGSMAYQESCRKIALDSQKLTTLIRYRLKTTGVSSGSQEALDLLGKNDLGLAIANNFKLKSGAQRRKCFSCADHIYMVGDNATEFFLSITFYTSSVCNLDTIFALGTHVVGKTQKVKYGKSQSFILNVVGILNRSISDLRYKAGLTLLYSYFKLWCGPYNTISKETFCPEVSIDSSEITYLENQTALRVTESGLNGTTSVCWNDYMLAMSKIYKSASPRQYHLAVFSMAVCVEFF